MPTYVVRALLYATNDSAKENAIKKIAEWEKLAASLVREGETPKAAAYQAVKVADGDVRRIAAALNTRGNRFYRERPESDGTGIVEARSKAAHERGTIDSKRDASIAVIGTEYRDALFDIDESDTLSSKDKVELYTSLRSMRDSWSSFTRRFEDALGHETSMTARKLLDEAVIKGSLYAAKYLIENGEKTELVSMGSRVVPVSMTRDKLLRANRYLARALKDIDTIECRIDGVDDTLPHNNVELGFVESREGDVMILTKARRAIPHSQIERGKSPRINLMAGIGGIIPSSVAAEREQNALSIRLDLDSDGWLRLDTGGKTDNPNTPDFIVAQMISLGAWYYSQVHNSEAGDYHLDIAKMSEDEFALVVERFRRAIEMSDAPLNVPLVAQQAPVSNLVEHPLQVVHQHEQDQKSAA